MPRTRNAIAETTVVNIFFTLNPLFIIDYRFTGIAPDTGSIDQAGQRDCAAGRSI